MNFAQNISPYQIYNTLLPLFKKIYHSLFSLIRINKTIPFLSMKSMLLNTLKDKVHF